MHTLTDLTEKTWELQIIGTQNHPGVARQVGFRVYHTLRSKGSQPGWPDWVLVRERIVYLELKSETGKPSQAQKEWIVALLNAGGEVYIARPRHLEPLAKILAARGDPFQRRDVVFDAALMRHQTRKEVDAA